MGSWYTGGLVLVILTVTVGWLTWAHNAKGDAVMSQQELLHRLAAKAAVLVLDVRTAQEFRAGHVPGAINVPHIELTKRLDEIREYQQQDVVVYCERGGRANTATHLLRAAGFTRIHHLDGDMTAWRAWALPLVMPAHIP